MFSFAAPPHKSVEPFENWRFFASLLGEKSGFFAGFAEKQGCFRVKRLFISSLRETPRIARAERADCPPIEHTAIEHQSPGRSRRGLRRFSTLARQGRLIQ